MSETLILDLAKLVISAAWADGELSIEEKNALKDLLFSLDAVSADDWAVLTMYMESPVSDEERQELLNRVISGIQNREDKALALKTLERLFSVDGKVTPEEESLMTQLKSDLSKVGGGLFSGFTKALKSAIGHRKATVTSSCLRENDARDYIHNTIYYDLTRQQKISGVIIDRPESELRKLCLATGLLAHIANIDTVISDAEQAAIRTIIMEDWALTGKQANLFVSISCDRATKGLDYFRLANSFFECTDRVERKNFLKTLFRIANAANKTDLTEIENIARISKIMKLSHKDFIDAKLTISRADRNGF